MLDDVGLDAVDCGGLAAVEVEDGAGLEDEESGLVLGDGSGLGGVVVGASRLASDGGLVVWGAVGGVGLLGCEEEDGAVGGLLVDGSVVVVVAGALGAVVEEDGVCSAVVAVAGG